MVSALLLLLLASPQEPASPEAVRKDPSAREARYVEIVDVPLPDDVVLEVGGMVLDGERMFVATRRGEVWRIDDVAGESPRPSLWAEGLQEPLGLVERDGWLYCAQRGELSRMRDADGDGRMDELETFADGWPISGNYHEYCFGPAIDADGSFWLTLNKPFGSEPFGRADWRGFALRIPKDGGAWQPVCAGLRSPAGVGAAPGGGVWYTDNQGEWCPTSKFALLEEGDFHGHPHGIASCKLEQSLVAYPGEVPDGIRMADAAKRFADLKLPAVWLPYDKVGRSPAGFVWDTHGNFPPFAGQVFCGDQYSSEVFRMSLERVDGAWQGACYPFRRGLQCGITRVLWGEPGTLWCGQTNRGWGSNGDKEWGLQRLVWRGETPFELREITATKDGFALHFTGEVSAASALPPCFEVKSWTYDLHEEYGCDPRDVQTHRITGVGVAADGMRVDLVVDGLGDCRVFEVKCVGVFSKQARELPWHGVGWYTRNRSPK